MGLHLSIWKIFRAYLKENSRRVLKALLFLLINTLTTGTVALQWPVEILGRGRTSVETTASCCIQYSFTFCEKCHRKFEEKFKDCILPCFLLSVSTVRTVFIPCHFVLRPAACSQTSTQKVQPSRAARGTRLFLVHMLTWKSVGFDYLFFLFTFCSWGRRWFLLPAFVFCFNLGILCWCFLFT